MFGKKDKLTSEQVMAALEKVTDPILEKGLIELGMVKNVAIDTDRVRIEVELPTPAWEAQDVLKHEINVALELLLDGRTLDMAWGSNVQSSRTQGSDGQNLVPGARNVILFASGKGGVGKSTIASNVSAALAQLGANVGLLDADIYGPSIPTMFGTKEMPAVGPGGNKLSPVQQHKLKLMSIGFVVDAKDAMTWRGPMLNGALIQFMRDVEWGDLDYLCLDLPPGTGDVQLTIAQNVKVSGAILVSTPQDVALVDVTRAKAMFDRVGIPILGVVENMSAFECSSCGAVHHIFSNGGAERLANELELPVLGQVPIELGVRESGDAGRPEVLSNPNSQASREIYKIAKRVATELAKQAIDQAEKAKNQPGGGRLRIVQ
ncbi:MAG: iron-sulfur cluster carrier protein ApbC [Myxococcota bacterium]|nr:iron-sulfur cluster carrier protein ApbC [Myxococcota bacterium]